MAGAAPSRRPTHQPGSQSTGWFLKTLCTRRGVFRNMGHIIHIGLSTVEATRMAEFSGSKWRVRLTKGTWPDNLLLATALDPAAKFNGYRVESLGFDKIVRVYGSD